MEVISFVASILLTILGFIWSILWWILSFFLMPLLIVLILLAIALRFAYRTPLLKPYVEALLKALGERGQKWAKQLLLSVTVMPIRVLLRFIGFSVLHAWINLWWRPKWSPWERAIQSPNKDKKN